LPNCVIGNPSDGEVNMISNELVGRRVRVIAWYDNARLIAAHRKAALPEGIITEVTSHVGDASLLVEIEGLGGTHTFKLADVGLLPPLTSSQ
jgi:hypothetical protein